MREGLSRARVKKEHIALIGFMGAGKTLIGKMLAKELKYEFVDVDTLIEQKAGVSISDIFNTKGVEHFRELEKQVLSELNLDPPTIVATGGGIVLDADNRDILKKNFNVIWLWTDITTIRSRIDSSDRPLFNDNVEDLLKQRTALYAETCDMCICNCHQSVDEVINKIKLELK
jgi:shikimate kinase